MKPGKRRTAVESARELPPIVVQLADAASRLWHHQARQPAPHLETCGVATHELLFAQQQLCSVLPSTLSDAVMVRFWHDPHCPEFYAGVSTPGVVQEVPHCPGFCTESSFPASSTLQWKNIDSQCRSTRSWRCPSSHRGNLRLRCRTRHTVARTATHNCQRSETKKYWQEPHCRGICTRVASWRCQPADAVSDSPLNTVIFERGNSLQKSKGEEEKVRKEPRVHIQRRPATDAARDSPLNTMSLMRHRSLPPASSSPQM